MVSHTRARQGSAPTTAVDPAERARELALRILTHAPRTSEELRTRLRDRGCDEAVVEEVIVRFEDVGLLNDAEIARTLVNARHRERGYSRRRIRDELVRKGIPHEYVEDGLSQITDEEERERAMELARDAWRKLASCEAEVRRRRVVGRLSRKGYSSSLVYSVVAKISSFEDS